jgi:hypothetical protein
MPNVPAEVARNIKSAVSEIDEHYGTGDVGLTHGTDLIPHITTATLLQFDCKNPRRISIRMRSIVSVLMIISLLIGCTKQASPLAADVDAPELATLTSAQVAQLTTSVDQPVIVEFSVRFGCDRCAKMRPQVCQLAMEQSEQISIVRADFTANQPLLQSLGATVCPSYVLFTPGNKPQIETSPEVLISLANSSADATTNQQMQ